MEYCELIDSPLGPLLIRASVNGITKVSFMDSGGLIAANPSALTSRCAKQLTSYFKGDLQEFDLALDPVGTDFQKRVWAALAKVGHGRTESYAQLARRLGNHLFTRAVGTANGANPIAIIVPCHRIIGSDASLTGYAGGLWRKKWLLEHESHQTLLF
jgi:methylated-DNA-[protein]-cysteine S-methyltransferase